MTKTGDLVDAPLGEEVAMMDVTSGTYFVLDAVAADIWNQLREPVGVNAILTELQSRYDIEPTRCEADVLGFLERLHDKGLIRVVS